MRSLLRFRFSTMLLLVLVVALLLSLLMLRRSQANLLAELSRFRDPVNEAVADIVDQPLVLTYADALPLEQFLKDIRLRSRARRSYREASRSTWNRSDCQRRKKQCRPRSRNRLGPISSRCAST